MFITSAVDTWEDALSHMPLWTELHLRLAPDNPFVSALWSRNWVNTHVGKKTRKVILLSSAHEGAEGLMLLAKGRTTRFKIPVKSIETIGAGVSAGDRHFVAVQEPLLTGSAIDSLLESVAAFKGWAFFRLAPLPSDYPHYDRFKSAAEQNGLTAFMWPYSVGYRIRTAMGWKAYEKSRSPKFRANMRASFKRMQSSGLFRIEALGNDHPVDDLLGILNCVSTKSWKVKSNTDIFNPAYKGFWRKVFADTIAANQTTLWVLYYDEQPIAYEWYLQQGCRRISLKADYDQAFARFSPGNLLSWHALRHSFRAGATEIDFLMGGGDYKHKWATEAYQLSELHIFNQSLNSRIWYHVLSRQDRISTWIRRLKRILYGGSV
jgi:CelD/BcsL family acetyltransferase involved in cellulose biosynthesis